MSASRRLPVLLSVSLLFLLGACIKNDIPYPRIEQNITAIAAEGEAAPAVISDDDRTVLLTLGEETDMRAVKFSQFEYTEGASSSVNLLDGEYNLTDGLVVTLSLYQDYQWTITATQPIERYFTIAGQVGETAIDPVGRRVVVKVSDSADLKKLHITSIKLGPKNVSTMVPDLKPGPVDLSKPLEVRVSAFGQTEVWTIYVEVSKALVATTAVDAWSRVIWAYGEAVEGAEQGFQYRLASESEWTEVPKSKIVSNGGSFSACISGLLPLTDYVVRAVSGENTGQEINVTTQATEVLPDSSFDLWWLNGKVWCPWSQDGTQFWDTGNTGAATLGQSNVQPSDDVPPGLTGKSAMLATKFVGIGAIGKLAAGSIYSGKFVKVDGTNGILDFGRPWSVRPTALTGYYKYVTAPINYASDEFNALIGRPDTCHIYIALTDWTAPYQIRTNPRNRQLFDKNSPSVIAYGELMRGSDTDGWQQFTIKFEYRSTSRVPSYILICSAASKYGDYFTGGTGATLWVDQYSLQYDY